MHSQLKYLNKKGNRILESLSLQIMIFREFVIFRLFILKRKYLKTNVMPQPVTFFVGTFLFLFYILNLKICILDFDNYCINVPDNQFFFCSFREKLIRLQHENKMLKLNQEGSDNEKIALLQSLLDDANLRKNELETENRQECMEAASFSCRFSLFASILIP